MFKCLECGRKFRTVKAAQRAAYGDKGCPGCGGSDIDLDLDAAMEKAAKAIPTSRVTRANGTIDGAKLVAEMFGGTGR